MDTERVAKSIDGLQFEKKMLTAQLKFSRRSAKQLFDELLASVREAEPMDPWTDKSTAQKSENKFKKNTCALFWVSQLVSRPYTK